MQASAYKSARFGGENLKLENEACNDYNQEAFESWLDLLKFSPDDQNWLDFANYIDFRAKPIFSHANAGAALPLIEARLSSSEISKQITVLRVMRSIVDDVDDSWEDFSHSNVLKYMIVDANMAESDAIVPFIVNITSISGSVARSMHKSHANIPDLECQLSSILDSLVAVASSQKPFICNLSSSIFSAIKYIIRVASASNPGLLYSVHRRGFDFVPTVLMVDVVKSLKRCSAAFPSFLFSLGEDGGIAKLLEFLQKGVDQAQIASLLDSYILTTKDQNMSQTIVESLLNFLPSCNPRKEGKLLECIATAVSISSDASAALVSKGFFSSPSTYMHAFSSSSAILSIVEAVNGSDIKIEEPKSIELLTNFLISIMESEETNLVIRSLKIMKNINTISSDAANALDDLSSDTNNEISALAQNLRASIA